MLIHNGQPSLGQWPRLRIDWCWY